MIDDNSVSRTDDGGGLLASTATANGMSARYPEYKRDKPGTPITNEDPKPKPIGNQPITALQAMNMNRHARRRLGKMIGHKIPSLANVKNR